MQIKTEPTLPSGALEDLRKVLAFRFDDLVPEMGLGEINDPAVLAELEKIAKEAGNPIDIVLAGLHRAAVRFLANRTLDEGPSDAAVIREIKDIADLPDDRLAARIGVTSDETIAAICGAFPGHYQELRAPDGQWTALLPNHDAVFIELVKTGLRRERPRYERRKTTSLGGGVVHRRRAPCVAVCISVASQVGEITPAIEALLEIVALANRGNDFDGSLLWGYAWALLSEFYPREAKERMNLLTGAATNTERHEILRAWTPVDVGELPDEAAKPQKFCRAVAASLLQIDDAEVRRQTLILLAMRFSRRFKRYLRILVRNLRRQYQLESDGRGAERTARRWVEAHAGWVLIRDVLDLVWPPKRGSLTAKTKQALIDIADATLAYADPFVGFADKAAKTAKRDKTKSRKVAEDDELPRQANLAVSHAHLSRIASLRSTIHELNEILAEMDRRLFELEGDRRRHGGGVKRGENTLRNRMFALQNWRREAERRLRQGDYEKGEAGKNKKRITGARLEIPEFSRQLKNQLKTLKVSQRIFAVSDLALKFGLGPRS